MGKSSLASSVEGMSTADCMRALCSASREERAGKVKALWAIVNHYGEQGKLPMIDMGDVTRAALEVSGTQTMEGVKHMELDTACMREISGMEFTLKLKLLSLLKREVGRKKHSAEVLKVLCETERLNASNISFARGLILSALEAGLYADEGIRAAGALLLCKDMCVEDRKAILNALAEAQKLGVDLSAAKSALQRFSGGRGNLQTVAGGLVARVGKENANRGFPSLARKKRGGPKTWGIRRDSGPRQARITKPPSRPIGEGWSPKAAKV